MVFCRSSLTLPSPRIILKSTKFRTPPTQKCPWPRLPILRVLSPKSGIISPQALQKLSPTTGNLLVSGLIRDWFIPHKKRLNSKLFFISMFFHLVSIDKLQIIEGEGRFRGASARRITWVKCLIRDQMMGGYLVLSSTNH